MAVSGVNVRYERISRPYWLCHRSADADLINLPVKIKLFLQKDDNPQAS
jgi:hypothetical protein